MKSCCNKVKNGFLFYKNNIFLIFLHDTKFKSQSKLSQNDINIQKYLHFSNFKLTNQLNIKLLK